jgi:putative hydrolase of the HAD superfamily
VRPLVAERLALSPEEFEDRWYGELAELREMAPMTDAIRAFGASPEVAEEIVSMRRAVTQRGLVPVPGAVETIVELRVRGLRVGLITICTDDVPALWPETAFHGLFDAEIFSCSVGLRKPDPRIYLLACEQLGVEPHEALFVGDGANDELAGAERVGMTAVLLERAGEEQEWAGRRVRSLPELLSIV